MSLGSRCYAINARGSKVVRNCANGGTNGETVLRDLEREREREGGEEEKFVWWRGAASKERRDARASKLKIKRFPFSTNALTL